MSKCACGRTYRKGSMAFVIENKRVVARRVCPECAAQAVPILSQKAEAKVVKKEVRSDVVQRCIRQLRTLAAAATSSSRASARDTELASMFTGKAEAYEGAIELLKRESGEA